MHIDAVDLEVVKASLSGIVQEMQNSLFRTGFSTIVRESQDASCALMNAKGEVVAQHVVLPLHIGAFPACCGAMIAEFGDDHRGRRRLPDQSSLPGRQPARARHVRASARCSARARCSASAARSRTRATSAVRCREAAPARRARPSTRACICRPCAISAASSRSATSSASSPPTAARPSWCLAISAGSSAPTGSASGGSNELVVKYGKAKVLACFDRLFEISETQAAPEFRGMEGRPLRGRAVRRRRRHRSGEAGAHPCRGGEDRRPHPFRLSAAPPTRPRDRPTCVRRWCRRPAPIA